MSTVSAVVAMLSGNWSSQTVHSVPNLLLPPLCSNCRFVFHIFSRTEDICKIMYVTCLYRRTKIRCQRYLRDSKHLYLSSIFPAEGGLVAATFAYLP